uniref:Uncharacterized protein n=1 Tax=Paulinella longichromatophora TaxID=1708747 RepID=A0A2H4ZNE1_9EUKA|nr:hypothetical protein PLO_037 [Paulinella longichromatophora]
MMLKSWSKRLKLGLDRIMITNIFILVAGSLYFVVAVILHFQHIEFLLDLFQRFWEPLFMPSLNLLLLGIISNLILNKTNSLHEKMQ